MPESFYPLAISYVFRETTFCVRNWAMIGRIPPLLSTTWIWVGWVPTMDSVADISQNPIRGKCQGTRFEISWHRTSCRNNLLPTTNQPSGWSMLETTRSDHMPGIAWVICTTSPDVLGSMIWNNIHIHPTTDPFQYLWSLSHTKKVQKPDPHPIPEAGDNIRRSPRLLRCCPLPRWWGCCAGHRSRDGNRRKSDAKQGIDPLLNIKKNYWKWP